jgi:Disaggregatase related repeat
MKRLSTLLALAAAVALVTAGVAGARHHWDDATVLQPDGTTGKTTFVMYRTDKTVCSNWGGYAYFHVGANALSIRRGLLQFDLSALPADERIVSAKLSVYRTETLRGSGVVGVHRVTTPWAGGTGVNTCTNDGATWATTGLGTPWSTPGGDFDSTDVSSVTKTAGESPGWDSFDVTSLARGWTDGAFPNDGLMLKLDDESFSPCTTVTNCNYWAYASDSYADPTLRPKLTIVYD